MIKLKIDVTKIPKTRLFKGAKGTYLDAVLMENRDGKDEYGNDGFIKIEVSKDAREAGEKGEIVGNWKIIGKSHPQSAPTPTRKPVDPDLDAPEEDDIPF